MTVQAMIGMFYKHTCNAPLDLFSSNHSTELKFEEFTKLWAFIENWQCFFRAVDKDNSGCIDFDELRTAITNSGMQIKGGCLEFNSSLYLVPFNKPLLTYISWITEVRILE